MKQIQTPSQSQLETATVTPQPQAQSAPMPQVLAVRGFWRMGLGTVVFCAMSLLMPIVVFVVSFNDTGDQRINTIGSWAVIGFFVISIALAANMLYFTRQNLRQAEAHQAYLAKWVSQLRSTQIIAKIFMIVCSIFLAIIAVGGLASSTSLYGSNTFIGLVSITYMFAFFATPALALAFLISSIQMANKRTIRLSAPTQAPR